MLSINVDEVKAKHIDFDDARKTMNSDIKASREKMQASKLNLLDMQCRSMKNNLKQIYKTSSRKE
jgi:hypothetical protein